MNRIIRWLLPFDVKEDKPKPPLFTLEYYKLTEYYHPKYKSFYFIVDNTTNEVIVINKRFFSASYKTKDKQKALDLIELFKQQSLNEDVKISIKV
jgi:hypothetical protein